MNEAYLKTRLREALRQELINAFVVPIEQRFGAGIPDINVTWRRRGAWLEVKFANPYLRVTPLQNRKCCEAAKAGECWYIVYRLDAIGAKSVEIYHPEKILDGDKQLLIAGFAHDEVAKFIRERLEL